MATYPGAIQRPISKNVGGPLTTVRGLILHTAASDAGGAGHATYWSRENVGVSAHFFIDYDGTCWQLVDTARQSWTSGAACNSTIGVETQGWGHELWTPQQAEALARLIAWASVEHKFPIQAMPDSKAGRRGVGWHAQGVAATTAQLKAGVSQTGGELWSKSRGKVCPGQSRIEQIPAILTRATVLAWSPDTPTPPVPPAPRPTPAGGQLVVDGLWGSATTRALQTIFRTPIDGVISGQPLRWRGRLASVTSGIEYASGPAKGSTLIRAMQRWLGFPIQDGILGRDTINALIRAFGFTPDGKLDRPSATVREMQNRINAGTLRP